MRLLIYSGVTVLCLFFFLYSNSIAQERNFVGLHFGVSDFHIRDDYASPLFFRGTGVTPSIQFAIKSKSVINSLELSFYYNYLRSINSNFNTNNYRGKVKYTYLHNITNYNLLENNLRLLLGASVSSFFTISDYRYIDDNLAIKSWYWNHSLNADLALIYSLDQEKYFSAKFSLPLISNISRPKYSPSENYSYSTNSYTVNVFGKMEYFPNNFFINIILTYHTPISDRFSLQLDYEYFYSLYDKSKEVDMFMNNFRAGLLWGF